MKIRITILAMALLLISCGAWAQDTPTVDFPVYPNADVTMEINMGNADILPMLKAMLPMMSGHSAKIFENINVDDLGAVLKDVTQIEFLQMDVTKAGVNESDIAGFYGKKLPEGKWSRVYWQSIPKQGTLAVYAQSNMEAIYGYQVQTVSIDGKPGKRVMVAKIVGKIDFAKLISIATKAFAPVAAPSDK